MLELVVVHRVRHATPGSSPRPSPSPASGADVSRLRPEAASGPSGQPRSLAQALTHRGYDVFLDVDSVDAGKWAEQITAQVPARAHFLLALTPGALDRYADEELVLGPEVLSSLSARLVPEHTAGGP